MQPQYNTTDQFEKRRRLLRKLVIFGIPGLIIIGIVAAIFWPRPSYEDNFTIHQTNLIFNKNHGSIVESDLLGYNGLSFYSINTQSGKATTLSTGLKLPVPDRVYWANKKGALMTFSSAFSRSEVELVLKAQGEKLTDETQEYSWYVDFNKNTLTLVNEDPVYSNLAYFSQTDNGYYYVTDQGSHPYRKTPLYFYDVSSGKNETVVDDLKLVDINAIQKCPQAKEVCLTARDQINPRGQNLYGIDGKDKKKTIFETDGQIYATNKPEYYVTVSRGLNEDNTEPTTPNSMQGEVDHVDSVDPTNEPAILRDLKNSKTYDLGFKVGAEEPVVHFNNDNEYYVTGITPETITNDDTYYISGKLQEGWAALPLTLGDNQPFTETLSALATHGSGKQILIAAADNSQFLINDRKSLSGASVKNSNEAQSAVKSCIAKGALESEYFDSQKEFRISFTDDATFHNKVKTFGTCLADTNSAPFHGYTFQFIGRDPVNGRIST